MNCDACAAMFMRMEDLTEHVTCVAHRSKNINSYSCIPCSVTLNSVYDIAPHIESEEHSIMVLATGIRFDAQPEGSADPFPALYCCILCSFRDFDHSSYIAHLKGSIHRNIARLMNIIIRKQIKDDKPETKAYGSMWDTFLPVSSCVLCNISFSSSCYTSHVESMTHIEAERFMNKINNVKQIEFVGAAQTLEDFGNSLFLPYDCNLCNIHFNKLEYYEQHLKSRGHERMQKLMIKIAHIKGAHVMGGKSDEIGSETFSNSLLTLHYCGSCKYWLSEIEYVQHVNGNTHERIGLLKSITSNEEEEVEIIFESRKSENSTRFKPPPNYCKLCANWCSDAKAYDEHLKNKEHIIIENFVNNSYDDYKKNAISIYIDEQADIKFNNPPPPNYCNICNVLYDTPEKYAEHLKCDRHKNCEKSYFKEKDNDGRKSEELHAKGNRQSRSKARQTQLDGPCQMRKYRLRVEDRNERFEESSLRRKRKLSAESSERERRESRPREKSKLSEKLHLKEKQRSKKSEITCTNEKRCVKDKKKSERPKLSEEYLYLTENRLLEREEKYEHSEESPMKDKQQHLKRKEQSEKNKQQGKHLVESKPQKESSREKRIIKKHKESDQPLIMRRQKDTEYDLVNKAQPKSDGLKQLLQYLKERIETEDSMNNINDLKREECVTSTQSPSNNNDLSNIPYVCNLCDMHFNKLESYQEHSKTEAHRKIQQLMNEITYIREANAICENPDPRGKDAFGYSPSSTNFCELCNFWFSENEYFQHINGNTHARIKELNMMLRNEEHIKIWLDICSSSGANFKLPLNYCKICAVLCPDTKSYYYHLKDKEHKIIENFIDSLSNEDEKKLRNAIYLQAYKIFNNPPPANDSEKCVTRLKDNKHAKPEESRVKDLQCMKSRERQKQFKDSDKKEKHGLKSTKYRQSNLDKRESLRTEERREPPEESYRKMRQKSKSEERNRQSKESYLNEKHSPRKAGQRKQSDESRLRTERELKNERQHRQSKESDLRDHLRSRERRKPSEKSYLKRKRRMSSDERYELSGEYYLMRKRDRESKIDQTYKQLGQCLKEDDACIDCLLEEASKKLNIPLSSLRFKAYQYLGLDSGTHKRKSSSSLRDHFCELCKFSCSTSQCYENHLKSEKHKKLRKFFNKNDKSFNVPSFETSGDSHPLQYFCELCDVLNPNSEQYKEHLESDKHKRFQWLLYVMIQKNLSDLK